jgi:hypothetical protein
MKTDWKAVSGTVLTILEAIYVREHDSFEKEAARRKITVEQLAAAAITEAVRQALRS